MSGRDAIMTRLRARMPATAGREDAVTARLAAPGQTAPQPQIATTGGAARIERFMAKVVEVDGTASRIASFEALPAALADEMRARNLGLTVRMGCEPAFAGLDWGVVETSEGPGRLIEPATLSKAAFAMAESGTCVLLSGPDNPVTLTFLGETHFIAIDAGDIKAGFEDMWTAFRASGRDPRTVNLVTGPSRSADIGQKLELGAHGPINLHVFVVG